MTAEKFSDRNKECAEEILAIGSKYRHLQATDGVPVPIIMSGSFIPYAFALKALLSTIREEFDTEIYGDAIKTCVEILKPHISMAGVE